MRPDSQLVEAAAAGDRTAAAELIERHAACAFAVCLAQLGDPDLAQDAAQDALLRALERLATLEDGLRFRAWLVAVARNLCRDYWKRERRRRELLEAHVASEAVTADGVAAVVADVEPDAPDLAAALARLPETHRLPLHLYYFDGLDTARVAEALGLTLGSACSRLCRARRALREILEASDD